METTIRRRRIKDIISKPSDALEAMCDGLENTRHDFVVNMGSFGGVDEDHRCFGCAATCAVQQIIETRFDEATIGERQTRADAIDVDWEDLRDFEIAIDVARQGFLVDLFEYFGLTVTGGGTQFDRRWCLDLLNWRQGIPKVRKAVEELRAKGL